MLVFDAIGNATLDATPESGNSLKSALALRQHGIPHRIRTPHVVDFSGFGTRCRVPSRKAPAGCRRNRRPGKSSEQTRLQPNISPARFSARSFPIASRSSRCTVSRLRPDERSCMKTLADQGPLTNLIIRMCQLMNFHMVAEGVETPAQLAKLADRKCDEHRGFLFSPAIDAAAFEAMLTA
jgi:hypothetical protein